MLRERRSRLGKGGVRNLVEWWERVENEDWF